MKRTTTILAAALLAGCASLPEEPRVALKLELEHVSHPFAGWPCGDKDQEDGVNQANALVVWRRGLIYGEMGIGYNLKGRDGGGFYGPAMTGTVRAGLEIPLR